HRSLLARLPAHARLSPSRSRGPRGIRPGRPRPHRGQRGDRRRGGVALAALPPPDADGARLGSRLRSRIRAVLFPLQVAQTRVRALPDRFRPVVACVRKEGPNLQAIEEMGLPIEVFALSGSLARANTGKQVMRLAAFLVQNRIKLVHANDFYTNVLAVPAARL